MNTITPRSWLVTGVVLSPLVFSGCVWQSDYDALKVQNNQLQSQNQQLQTHVAQLQHAIAYTVSSDMLFKPGSWEMSSQGKDIIKKFTEKLAPTQRNKVVVSGYTDNSPIGSGLKRRGVTTNQELSQRRADEVVQYLTSQGVKQDTLAAQGFGDADPIASNDTPNGRAQNRRVVLSVGSEIAQSSPGSSGSSGSSVAP